jgi:hypothetical protein
VIVLLLSYLLQGKEVRFRQMAKFAPLVLVGYVFANPTVILSFIEFLDGTTRDLFYNVLREGSEPASYKKILGDIKSGMGLPLFLISLAGFGYGIWSLSTGRHRAEFIFLTATIVPYYFVFGLRLAAVWYIPFFFPALSVFAAVLCIRVQDIAGTLAMRTLVVAVALFSLMSSVFLILQFTYDSRYLASEWINRQIPNNAVLEIGPRGPAVSNEKYRLIERSIHQAFGGFAFAREARDKMEVNRVYRSIRKCILDLEQLMSLKLGMAVRQEPYKAWFDRALDQSESSSGEPSRKEKPGESSPDYKILVDYLERGTISALKSKESKYQLVTTIQYMNPLGLEITFPFVNPKIYVFRRNYAPPPAG